MAKTDGSKIKSTTTYTLRQKNRVKERTRVEDTMGKKGYGTIILHTAHMSYICMYIIYICILQYTYVMCLIWAQTYCTYIYDIRHVYGAYACLNVTWRIFEARSLHAYIHKIYFNFTLFCNNTFQHVCTAHKHTRAHTHIYAWAPALFYNNSNNECNHCLHSICFQLPECRTPLEILHCPFLELFIAETRGYARWTEKTLSHYCNLWNKNMS